MLGKSDPSPQTDLYSPYRWIIVLVSTLIVFGALGLGRFGYTMILPYMKKGLSLTDVQVGDLATGNLAGYLVLSVAFGFLASRFSSRWIISLSMLIVTGALFLTGRAEIFIAAFVFRFLTGAGSGGANVPVMALLSSWFHKKQRGLAAGIVVSGSGIGLLVTGFLVPRVMADRGDQGWSYAWYALGFVALAVTLSAFVLLRDRPTGDKPSAKPDWRKVVRRPAVWYLGTAYFLFGFSYIIYTTFFAYYLTRDRGYTPEAAGSLWSVVGFISLVSGLLWGVLSDRLGRRRSLIIVFSLQAISYAVFGLTGNTTALIISAVLFGITAWSIPAIVAAATGDILGARMAPAGLGFLTLFFGIGQMAGPFAAGRIAEVAGTYSAAYIAAGGAALLGALASLLLLERDSSGQRVA